MMRLQTKSILLATVCALAVMSCGDENKIQPGERLSLSSIDSTGASTAAVGATQISGQSATSWPQHLGGPTHLVSNPAFDNQPNLIMSYVLSGSDGNVIAPILSGLGGNKTYGTSTPVIVGNQIFYYDSQGTVHAVNTAGQALWTKSLVPPGFSAGDGLGGGIAYSDGMIYATTGYGEIVALSASTGARAWTYVQNAPIHKPPLVADGIVIAVSEGANAVALTRTTGQVVWRHYGNPNSSPTRLNAGVPAAKDGKVVLSYASGAIAMLDIQSGQEIWKKSTISDAFTGQKSVFSDITGDPVIDGDRVILGTGSGILSLSMADGSTLWSQSVGTKGPLMVSGNSIFGLTPTNEVFRLDRGNGSLAYKVGLPTHKNTNVFKTGKFSYGDLRLAGGALWVSNGKNQLVRINPSNGSIAAYTDLGTNLETAPIFGNGIMVGVSDAGQILAYR